MRAPAAAILAATLLACARPAGPELEMVFEAQGDGATAAEKAELTAEAFRRRIDHFGIDGSVEVLPGNRVVVRLSGVDPERVKVLGAGELAPGVKLVEKRLIEPAPD